MRVCRPLIAYEEILRFVFWRHGAMNACPMRTVYSGLRLAHSHLEDKAGTALLSLDELARTVTRAKMEWRASFTGLPPNGKFRSSGCALSCWNLALVAQNGEETCPNRRHPDFRFAARLQRRRIASICQPVRACFPPT
jgi:hypothetical protein